MVGCASGPITPELLVEELADRLAAAARAGRGRLRVAVDGPPAAGPDRLADALVDPLRVRGRPALRDRRRRTSCAPRRCASSRAGPTRTPTTRAGSTRRGCAARCSTRPARAARAGSCRRCGTPATDRATRAALRAPAARRRAAGQRPAAARRRPAVRPGRPPGAVARRAGPAYAAPERWTLPAFARYAEEVDPAGFADVVVRVDDPRHPALVEPRREPDDHTESPVCRRPAAG